MKRKIVYSFLAVLIAVTVIGYAAYYRDVNWEPQSTDTAEEYEEILAMLIVKLKEEYPERFNTDPDWYTAMLNMNKELEAKITD